ncbi:MAG: glycosyltransferase family 1 protein [Actinobacteria bacterium]|nr:MAG: glycosyltransferase family 1 protein [Actinomycetota bacterium]
MGQSILLLVSSTQRRGAEVFGEHLAGALESSGWSVDFYALKRVAGGSEVSATPILGPEGATSGLRPGLIRRLGRIVDELEPDVVMAGGGATLKYSVSALWGRPGPALVYSSIGEPEFWANNPARKLMMTGLLRRTDLVTAVSRATADQLIDGFGVEAGKVHVAHPGVPSEYLDVGRERRSDELHVLFVGSMSDEKDPMAALECLEAMERPSRLRFLGTGPLVEQVRSVARPSVEIAGSVEDVKPHLAWADVLLLTSRTEGLPGVVLEAAASGLPVVAFDVVGVGESVHDGETGFTHTRGDIHSMAASLDLLAGDDDLRHKMGRSARELVEGHFLLNHAVQRYIDVLEALVK